MYNPKAHVELFHLMFLRLFGDNTNAALYGVKGGCNLRFFFGSHRYSEDLDIDVTTISPETLKKKVSKLLDSVMLTKLLQSHDILDLSMTTPKQTPTTQRWKIQLHTKHSNLPLHTKIEFSRRNSNMTPELANIDRHLCQRYKISPMRLSHYTLKDALAQKIQALAHRTQVQSRDAFDIFHLLHREEPRLTLDHDTLHRAQEALLSIDFSDYKSQVVSFLEPDQQSMHGDPCYWSSVSNTVLEYLEGLTQ